MNFQGRINHLVGPIRTSQRGGPTGKRGAADTEVRGRRRFDLEPTVIKVFGYFLALVHYVREFFFRLMVSRV